MRKKNIRKLIMYLCLVGGIIFEGCISANHNNYTRESNKGIDRDNYQAREREKAPQNIYSGRQLFKKTSKKPKPAQKSFRTVYYSPKLPKLNAVAQQLPQKKSRKKVTKTFFGNASYYGDKFHGRKTANGEVYNQFKLTAAHKELPFGTVCRVTNQANQKSVMVRINDRGPFIKGRVIDLSYQASRQIGGVLPGVIAVKIEILQYGKK